MRGIILNLEIKDWSLISDTVYRLSSKIRIEKLISLSINVLFIDNVNVTRVLQASKIDPPHIIIAVVYIFICLYFSCPPYCGYRFKYLRK